MICHALCKNLARPALPYPGDGRNRQVATQDSGSALPDPADIIIRPAIPSRPMFQRILTVLGNPTDPPFERSPRESLAAQMELLAEQFLYDPRRFDAGQPLIQPLELDRQAGMVETELM